VNEDGRHLRTLATREEIGEVALATRFGFVQRNGGADEGLQRLLIELIELLALGDVDGAPDVAIETRVEETRRVLCREAPLAKVIFTLSL